MSNFSNFLESVKTKLIENEGVD